MKRFLCNRWILFALRVLIGAIFIYSGVLKVQQPLNFADSVATFQLLPIPVISIFALALPPFEIITGLMLLTGWKRRLAALALCILAIIFAIALGQALLRGLQVDCGCFGSGKPSVLKTWASLGRDILLMGATLWLYIVFSRQGKEGPAA